MNKIVEYRNVNSDLVIVHIRDSQVIHLFLFGIDKVKTLTEQQKQYVLGLVQ